MGLAGWNNDNKLTLTIDSSKIDVTLLQGNITDKTQCTASSEYSVSYKAEEAWDGIADGGTGNSWLSSAANGPNPDGSCYLQWDFGDKRAIHSMRFHTRGNAGGDIWPSNIKILGSNTGAFGGEEVTLYDDDVPGASGMSPAEWSVWMQFTNHGCYQYLRVEIHESYKYQGTYTWVAVQEVEFRYGLSDFPVLISLSSNSGQTGADTTCVFDELTTVSGSYVNRKKIAVTTTISGVETELYVEVERWDDTASPGNEQAWLWTKVPTLVSGTDTDLYLYYDSNHTTNSGYIGDTGETPAKDVWDDNFKAVYHMTQDPSGGSNCILDSTSNSNYGTPQGSMTTDDLVDGKIGKAIDFDGGDDEINITSITLSNGTVEWVQNVDGYGTWTIFCGKDAADTDFIGYYPSSTWFRVRANDTDSTLTTSLATTIGNWCNFAIKLDGTNADFFKNGFSLGTAECVNSLDIDTIAYGFTTAAYHLDGRLCEFRISNTDRSNAWVKATYYSNWDDLITYLGVEVDLNFDFTNPVPTHLSTVYGVAHTLQLTTTISGPEPNYVYSAVFYDALDDSQIGSTVFGVNSGQPASTTTQTPSGIDYSWYLIATSSGQDGPSSTYTFTNKFLCSGTTEVDSVLTADIPVRLYRRSNGVLIGSTTSISGGLFEIESTYNENHYAIAIHPTDSGTNALIYDWLTP